jgi:hypothetical protein
MLKPVGKYWLNLAAEKVPHRGPVDVNGIPMIFLPRHKRGPGPVYHPVAIMQHALGSYDRALAGDATAQEAFSRCARWVRDNAVKEHEGRFLAWFYSFPLRTPPVHPPWISGMAQGQGLSVLAREISADRINADCRRGTARSEFVSLYC